MPLTPGTTLGPYEILEPIGAGGMGEVYRARDRNLNRDVALKALPAALANDDDYLARFQREAQVLASLNHTNIAAIYGLESQAIVMELVEGQTLAERIARGPIPLDEALPIARQIADALEAAHEKGVVHRDLKPANVKVTPEGVVKVLDFGLAKTNSVAAASDPQNSPTLTIRGSDAGLIMGTAAYMSPEQVRGKPVDKRADIWAFGLVLAEMFTGKPLFKGETVSDILAAVIREQPSLEAVPPHLEPVLEKCLRKDVRQRWRDIGDVRIALEEAQPADLPRRVPARHAAVPWAIAALLAVALGLALLFLPSHAPEQPLLRLPVELGPNASIHGVDAGTLIISPDGSRLVFGTKGADGQTQLAVRALDQAKPTALSGTEGARMPFFSPDGKWIGFNAGGKLKKISAEGGAVTTLCDAPNFRGGAWTTDGFIIAALDTQGPLVRITETGGFFKPLIELDKKAGEATQRWPQLLPGGKVVLFTSHSITGNYEDATIAAQSLVSGQRSVLWKGGSFGRYAPSGHLLFVHSGTVFAAPMDLARLKLTGQPSPVVEAVVSNAVSGGAGFDFSRNGVFVFLSGESTQHESIYWMMNSVAPQLVSTIPGAFSLRLAPDGRRFALSISEGSGRYVWIYDAERETRTRLTSDGASDNPIWSPDGSHICYVAQVGAANELQCARADGVGQKTKLYSSASGIAPGAFSPDGKRLCFAVQAAGTGMDIWIVPVESLPDGGLKPGAPEPFLQTPFNEAQAEFSPDGRWIAYMSDETGRQEVFVRSFPGPGSRWQISNGGNFPVWSRNGHELFYISGERMMAVSYRAARDSFIAEKPRLAVDHFVNPSYYRRFDVAPDGKRFAQLRPLLSSSDKASTEVIFLLNFFDELRRRSK